MGYLRALLHNPELPGADLVAAHLGQVVAIGKHPDREGWREHLIDEVIALLKDDYPQLMDVLTAVSAKSESEA